MPTLSQPATTAPYVLIDGHSLAYRMYFALENTRMKNSAQQPTWAVYGFFRALFDVIKQVQPAGLAVSFDMARETFRSELYPDYKAHRQSMPDDMPGQIDAIRQGIEALGIPIYEMPEFEADDVIGTLARQAAKDGHNVVILTGDQDAFQVIDPDNRISLLVPAFKGGLTSYDRHKVFEKWGVTPEQVTDFKGLKGDTSDNIPGIPGIGDKTAAKLLAEFGDLETVLANAEAVSGKKLKESLVVYAEQAKLSKVLATIRYDVPVQFDAEAFALHLKDTEPFMGFLSAMEFRSLTAQAHTLLDPFLNGNASSALSAAPKTPELTLTVQTETDPPKAIHPTPAPTASTRVSVGHAVSTLEDVTQFIQQALTTGVMALDIETSSLDVHTNQLAGIALSWSPQLTRETVTTQNQLKLSDYPKTVTQLRVNEATAEPSTIYIPLQHPEWNRCLSWEDVRTILATFTDHADNVLICHNAKFEFNTFRQLGLDVNATLFDTMITSYVLNPNRRHGLKLLSDDLLNRPMQEITELIGKGKKQIPFTQVALDNAVPYACEDAHNTWLLACLFVSQLSPRLMTLLNECEFPLIRVLAELEWNGISVDEAYLMRLSEQLAEMLETIEATIYEQAGVEFNLNSPKQVSDVLFNKLGLPTKGKTASKTDFSTSAKVLEALAPDYPIVQHLLDYRQLYKLKSTYIDVLPSLVNPADNRLHASFNQAVAVTGRLSSSDPNMQNIPVRSEIGRSIRQSFVPRDRQNSLIVSADYSQIELRLLAHLSEDPAMMEAFNQGEDIHKATAALVFDVPPDKVTKDMRYRAKAVNFGIIYGQTAYGLSQTLDIPPREAQVFIDRYFERYGHVKAFIDATIAKAHETGRVETMLGRVRDVSEDLGSRQKFIREFAERAAFNMPIQGTAADLMKLAMNRLWQALRDDDLGIKMILQVHDELVLEVPKKALEQAKTLVTWAMELEQPLKVPLVVDVAAGPTWMEVDE